MPDVEVVSFGFLHGVPPEAHLVLDLREHFRDPHVDPSLRYLTAEDGRVVSAVLDTPGIVPLLEATAATVRAFLAGPSGSTVRVAVGCAGGRHRAAAVASLVADLLAPHVDSEVRVRHRDLSKPVVAR